MVMFMPNLNKYFAFFPFVLVNIYTIIWQKNFYLLSFNSKNSSPEPEGTENHLEDNDDDEYDDQVEVGPPSATVTSTIGNENLLLVF